MKSTVAVRDPFKWEAGAWRSRGTETSEEDLLKSKVRSEKEC